MTYLMTFALRLVGCAYCATYWGLNFGLLGLDDVVGWFSALV